MVLSVLDKKEQLVFKEKITFFDKSMSEYKHILRNFKKFPVWLLC